MPGRRNRSHPDLPGRAVCIHNDASFISQVDAQHAVTDVALHIIGIKRAKHIFDVAEFFAGYDIKRYVIHATRL